MGLSLSRDDTLFDVLTRNSLERPDAPFLVFESGDGSASLRSYADMRKRAAGAALHLLDRGVGPGDRVHVHLPNCPEFFDCWFGTAAIGAIMVPTNPLLTGDELSYVVGHAGCRLSVTQADLVPAVSAAQDPERIVVADDARGRGDAPSSAPKVSPSDVAAVLYTSGTTSRPKGVLVTHANYLHADKLSRDTCGWGWRIAGSSSSRCFTRTRSTTRRCPRW